MNAKSMSITVDQTASLSTQALSVTRGHRRVIEALSLTLTPGAVTAIVGPNGCGKSTLLNTLARILMPEQGQVILNGHDIQQLPSREVAQQLALLPQETQAPEGMTVEDLVRFGRQPHQGLFQQWSQEDQTAVQAALSAADLLPLRYASLDQLSGGQRQRAWIAMTIAQSTPLLLLDEPTSALDLGHQIEVFELIRRLASQGRTVAMVVHDLLSACRYADQLVAMVAGEVIAHGPPGEILTPELVFQLYRVHCDIIEDPFSGSPMLANVRRA